MSDELAMDTLAKWLKPVSGTGLRVAALALAALVLAGCQSAPAGSGPGTVTSGATTVTTGGAVRIDAGYVGG